MLSLFSLSLRLSYTFQIYTSVPGAITWRVLSCFCKHPEPCSCYKPQQVVLAPTPTPNEASAPGQSSQVAKEAQGIHPVSLIGRELIGKWCLVMYDDSPFPGIIQDVDDENGAMVKTMSSVGKNRFFWPMRDDVIWYELNNILGLIPEPQPVTARHMRLSELVWKDLCYHYEI